MFPIHVRIFPFRWRLYCNGCAVDRSDYIGKTGYLCKLRFDVCLVCCIIWKPYIGYLAEMRMIPFKTAGMAQSSIYLSLGQMSCVALKICNV